MKKIDVQNQPVLPPRRVFQIALTGVKYRLFRAAVTVAVIVVAMAFLMNVLTESLIKRSVADSAREQIEDMHRVDLWIARLSTARPTEEILARLAADAPPAGDLRELGQMGGYTEEEIAALRPRAKEAMEYLQFFAELDYGRRRVLAGPDESVRIFFRLQGEKEWETFTSGLAAMKTVRFPSEPERFREFLAGWRELNGAVESIRRGQAEALAKIRERGGGQPLATLLRDANGEFGDVLRDAGFALGEEEAEALSEEVRRLEHGLRVEGTINNPGVRQEVAALLDVLPGDVAMQSIWKLLRDRSRAEWFLETMRANQVDPGDLDAETLEELARQRARARRRRSRRDAAR